MKPELQCGIFDAESSWRPPGAAQLPVLPRPAKNLAITTMDELLFPWRETAKGYVTTLPIDEIHRDYLFHLRGGIAHTSVYESIDEWLNEQPRRDYYERLGADLRLAQVSGSYDLRPYAVTPSFRSFASEWGQECLFPPLAAVVRANSKVFSTWMAQELEGATSGRVVHSVEDLMATVENATSEVLIKDPFGVSGSGQYLIRDQQSAARLALHLKQQLDKGRFIEFIVEPYTPFAMEFGSYYHLDRSGEIQHIGLCITKNRGAAYAASLQADQAFTSTLTATGYFSKALDYCHSVRKEGYWGPICIDSAILPDGSVRTVVEINARLSMGMIATEISSFLEYSGTRADLYCFDLAVHPSVRYEDIHKQLTDHKFLWQEASPAGVIPLTTGTFHPFPGWRKDAGLRRVRWHCAVVGRSVQERMQVHAALCEIVSKNFN